MKGYWNRPDATAEAIDADGWFKTGDMATVDDDGYFFIVDRKKDLIIRGGFNVYPREIEEVLYEHPAVREAAVVGVPHAELGEEVGAAVALKAGADVDPGGAARVRQGAGRRLQVPAQRVDRRRAAQGADRQDPQARDRAARRGAVMSARLTDSRVDPVDALAQGERAWGALPLAGRVELLSELGAAVSEHAAAWVEAASAIKRLAPGSPWSARSGLSGPYPVLASPAALRESLEALRRGGSPLDGFSCTRAPGGRVPCGSCRTACSTGCCSAASRSTCGCRRASTERPSGARAGLAQRDAAQTGGVALVLGAATSPRSGRWTSSTSSSPTTGSSVLKLNPVTDPLLRGARARARAVDRAGLSADRHRRGAGRLRAGLRPAVSAPCT